MHTFASPSVRRLLAHCALLASASLAGCAIGPQLVPAPDAQLVPGPEDGAFARTAGVRITAVTDAWDARPENLDEEVTPLKVSIENDSGRPLRIRYNEFALVSGTGTRYPALPPLQIEGKVPKVATAPVYTPRFAYDGFYPAPYYGSTYTGLTPWTDPWVYDSVYYDRYYPVWQVPLPTQDMRELAIPEGVIEPGGSISGFLYFPRVEGDDRRIVFVADLRGAEAGKQMGEARIPFVVQ